MEIKVHEYPLSAAAQRVILCLTEKDLEYELVFVDLPTGQQKKEPFISIYAVQPFGQVPGFEDGDLKLFESRAITKYISCAYADKGTPLITQDPKKMAIIGVWLEVEAHRFDAAAQPLNFEVLVKPIKGLATVEALVEQMKAQLDTVLNVYEKQLSESKYLGGGIFSPPSDPPPDDGAAYDAVPGDDSDGSTVSKATPNLSPSPIKLLHVSFNQDYGCFAAGTDRGLGIYNCDPFREVCRRDLDGNGGGLGAVEMLFRCNILGLVGGGDAPQYPSNKVVIWDDHQSRSIVELSFRSEVSGVRLRRDRVIVVLEQKIFVYNFTDLKLLHQIETIANPKGLCVVSQVAESFLLVCPGLQKGQVRVEHYASKRTKFITAHDSRIACFTLSQDGNLLATASSKGTLVRIYNTRDGSFLQEVRRGADRAEIYSLAFSPTAQWLAVSSDKGTAHVFGLKANSRNVGNERPNSPEQNSSVVNSRSSLSFIKGVLPKYFSSEWSVAQFRLPKGSQYIVAFGHQENTVVILGLDGSFYRCQFDPATGGEMAQLEYHNFLKPEESFSIGWIMCSSILRVPFSLPFFLLTYGL